MGSCALSIRKISTIVMLSLFLGACAQWEGLPIISSRNTDSAPLIPLNPDYIRDAVPRIEPITAAGNKSPYTVLGKTYTVMKPGQDYQAQGIASWYGTKFHGRNTSNGERYSLYGMTAAHNSLPIPSYVRVTNLANGRSTVVRVNDRGPFHEDRIIDLSYAAATKLGYASQGTARVQVELIRPGVDKKTNKNAEKTENKKKVIVHNSVPSKPAPSASTIPSPQTVSTAKTNSAAQPSVTVPNRTGRFLQAGAYKNYQSAALMQQRLLTLLKKPVIINPGAEAYYRVQIGPVSEQEITEIKLTMRGANMETPHLVKKECELVAAC